MPLEPCLPQYVQTAHGRCYQLGQWQLPGVTTILQATRPAQDIAVLEAWVKRVGEEQARAVRTRASERGVRVHALSEQYIQGIEPDPAAVQPVQAWWSSLKPFLDRLSNPQLAESAVYNPRLGYAGTIDLLADFNEKLTLVDYKTANSARTQPDHLLQLAAYAGALRQTHAVRVEQAVIAIARTDGPAGVYRYNRPQIKKAWYLWLQRLKAYWELHGDHPLAATAIAATCGALEMAGRQSGAPSKNPAGKPGSE